MCCLPLIRPATCPKHPDGVLRLCRRCITDTIAGIATDDYLKQFNPDPTTLQLVLDVLDQKLGI